MRCYAFHHLPVKILTNMKTCLLVCGLYDICSTDTEMRSAPKKLHDTAICWSHGEVMLNK
jgi:hypothetical protein